MSETSFAFKTLTAQQVQALARAHITHFERLLSGEGANIRKDECRGYLALWKSILAKVEEFGGTAWKALCTQEEEMEIEDACFSGDYDALLASCTNG
jgi:hypothetical protein